VPAQVPAITVQSPAYQSCRPGVLPPNDSCSEQRLWRCWSVPLLRHLAIVVVPGGVVVFSCTIAGVAFALVPQHCCVTLISHSHQCTLSPCVTVGQQPAAAGSSCSGGWCVGVDRGALLPVSTAERAVAPCALQSVCVPGVCTPTLNSMLFRVSYSTDNIASCCSSFLQCLSSSLRVLLCSGEGFASQGLQWWHILDP